MTAVLLNGEARELPEGATVESAVVAAGAPGDGRGVAVALDGEVVPRARGRAPIRSEGQKVEVAARGAGGCLMFTIAGPRASGRASSSAPAAFATCR